MHQVAGKLALLDLLADVLGVVRFEDVVQIGQHRSQRQSHGQVPGRVFQSESRAAIKAAATAGEGPPAATETASIVN